jgi:hypothetical protein
MHLYDWAILLKILAVDTNSRANSDARNSENLLKIMIKVL